MATMKRKKRKKFLRIKKTAKRFYNFTNKNGEKRFLALNLVKSQSIFPDTRLERIYSCDNTRCHLLDKIAFRKGLR